MGHSLVFGCVGFYWYKCVPPTGKDFGVAHWDMLVFRGGITFFFPTHATKSCHVQKKHTPRLSTLIPGSSKYVKKVCLLHRFFGEILCTNFTQNFGRSRYRRSSGWTWFITSKGHFGGSGFYLWGWNPTFPGLNKSIS